MKKQSAVSCNSAGGIGEGLSPKKALDLGLKKAVAEGKPLNEKIYVTQGLKRYMDPEKRLLS